MPSYPIETDTVKQCLNCYSTLPLKKDSHLSGSDCIRWSLSLTFSASPSMTAAWASLTSPTCSRVHWRSSDSSRRRAASPAPAEFTRRERPCAGGTRTGTIKKFVVRFLLSDLQLLENVVYVVLVSHGQELEGAHLEKQQSRS